MPLKVIRGYYLGTMNELGNTGRQEQKNVARRKRESTRAMGGRNARKTTARGRKAATARSRKSDGHTRQELYAKAKTRHIEGRSKMSKRQLENALGLRRGCAEASLRTLQPCLRASA